MDFLAHMRPELKQLVLKMGSINSIELITTLFDKHFDPEKSRACYKIKFDDGRYVKARAMGSLEETHRVITLHQKINSNNFSKILAFSDSVYIEEWIEGKEGNTVNWDYQLLEEAGRILATLHSEKISEVSSQNSTLWFKEVSQNLDFLFQKGKLDTKMIKTASEQLDIIGHKTIEIGIIHGDFCSENIIQTHRNKLYIIDNETIRLAPLDYDLGRTLWRWPMPQEHLNHFLCGYSKVRNCKAFQKMFTNWLLTALIDSSAFRIRSHAPDDDVPIKKLRMLLLKIKQHQDNSKDPITLDDYYA